MALGIPAGLVLPPSLFSSFLSTKGPLRNEIRKVHYLCMCLYMFFFLCVEGNVQKTTDGTVHRFLISFQV